MRMLAITPDSQALAQRVVDFANAHPLNIHEIHRCVRQKVPIAQDKGFSCVIPMGFFCSFTIEQQAMGWVRHVSISLLGCNDKTPIPNPFAIDEILKMFGFTCKYNTASCAWVEDTVDGGKAANFIQLLPSEDQKKLCERFGAPQAAG